MSPRCLIVLAVFTLVTSLIARTVQADEGMWLFSRPPTKILKEKYQFEPDAQWLERVQKSCVRFSSGGSGSLISANGLVMTNHHVGSDQVGELSTPERDLLKDGYFARTQADELKCHNLELDILWTIRDVTRDVQGVVTANMSAADAGAARRKKIAAIEKDAKESAGLQAEVVTLYHGARYHLYLYKRYTDIRLVFVPESQIAFFGGDNDNFEYPRFNLDVCFFRIYENGKPLKPEHYLRWSEVGANEGDLTFICGHPGKTQRLFTMDHLRVIRDLIYPLRLQHLWRREVQLLGFSARGEENERIAQNDLQGVQNSRKAITGVLAGLHDPTVMKTKEAAEREIRAAVDANPEFKKKWGDAWQKVGDAEKKYATFALRHMVLESRPAFGSDLYTFARMIVRLAAELPKPDGDRLTGYHDADLDSLYLRLYSGAPVYESLEVDRLAGGLSLLAERFGCDDPLVVKLLDGLSPRARAEALVKGTKLTDVDARKKLAEGGAKALADSTDPMIKFAAAIDPEARVLRKRFEDEVESVERDNYAKIAAAKFEIHGEDAYPDATFTLRFAFGPIKGFKTGSGEVPAFTDFAGLYQRHAERKGLFPFNLPPRWEAEKSRLNLKTPYNFICTADIIGGNSGSPVINKAGELIGIVFDGNIDGLVWDIAYTDATARAVCVDARAIIHAMRELYGAGALAEEILGAARAKKATSM